MYKYALAGFLGILIAVYISAYFGLPWSYRAVLFGLLSLLAAPFAVHKIPDARIAMGCILTLALFASRPIKLIFGFDGFVEEGGVTLAYTGLLWVAGLGWKRSWDLSA